MIVAIPVKGTCVTRNGNYPVSQMQAEVADKRVKVGFVSRDLHRALHSGFTIDVESMDKFCQAWLKMRSNGKPDSALNAGKDKITRASQRLRSAVDQYLMDLAQALE